MRDWKVGNLLLVLGILAGVGLALAGLNRWLPGDHELKDLAAVMQAVVTMAAIIYAGIVAAAKLEVFRDFEPHLTISHQVNHRAVGDSYAHIAAKVTLHNSSKVRVEVRSGIFRIHQIAPLEDPEIENIYSQVFEARELDDLQWPTLDETQPAWEENELVIEPGEAHHYTVEFIISVDHKTVLIYTYFYNSYYLKGRKAPQGWGETTVYDILEKGRTPAKEVC